MNVTTLKFDPCIADLLGELLARTDMVVLQIHRDEEKLHFTVTAHKDMSKVAITQDTLEAALWHLLALLDKRERQAYLRWRRHHHCYNDGAIEDLMREIAFNERELTCSMARRRGRKG